MISKSTDIAAKVVLAFIGKSGRISLHPIRIKKGIAMEIENDTEIFDAMRWDSVTGDRIWTGRKGTRAAIHAQGFTIDPISWGFCPHQWLDEHGYVDPELSHKHPRLGPRR